MISNKTKRWISIAFGFYSAVLLIVFVVFILINTTDYPTDKINLLDTFVSIVSLSFLGVLLSLKRPGNVIGWLLVVVAMFRQTAIFRAVAFTFLDQGQDPTFWLLILNNLWIFLSGLTYSILAYVIILFPTGRLPSPRWRAAKLLLLSQGLLTFAMITIYTNDLIQVLSSNAGPSQYALLTPVVTTGIISLASHFRPLPELDFFIFLMGPIALVLVVLGLWSQINRYRHGNYVVRQQIKWVIFAVVLWVFGLITIVFPIGVSTSVLLLIGPLIPLSIVVAILRYHLYDIDLIIRRTVVYAALSGLLLIIYFGSVTLLQNLVSLLSGQESPVIIVISTLLIAAMFTPLRSRVQGFIDRRFYRQKYDSELTLSQFAGKVRDEVDLDALTADLTSIINESLQPASLSLWLNPHPGKDR